jgi:hypothetical protein
MFPFVCLHCRSTFKRRAGAGEDSKTCPRCGKPAYRYDTRFRPPRKSDDAQWARVRFLFRHGFRFQKVYHKTGSVWTRARYPATMEEARVFVKAHADQAWPCVRI